MAAPSNATADAWASPTSARSPPALQRQEPTDHPNGRPSLPQVCHSEVTDSSANSLSVGPEAATASDGKAQERFTSRSMRALACRIQCWPEPSEFDDGALDDTVTDPPSTTTLTTRGSPTTIG